MAQKPDGKSAKTDRVTFTRAAAERIASAVRELERGDRDAVPYSPSPRFTPQQSQKIVFRIATFAGSWDKNTSKTVTFKYQTATPNTAVATNLFWPIPDCGERDCAIGKDGTAWYLLVPGLFSADAATAATITESALEFHTIPVVALCTSGTAVFSVSVSTCSTSA